MYNSDVSSFCHGFVRFFSFLGFYCRLKCVDSVVLESMARGMMRGSVLTARTLLCISFVGVSAVKLETIFRDIIFQCIVDVRGYVNLEEQFLHHDDLVELTGNEKEDERRLEEQSDKYAEHPGYLDYLEETDDDDGPDNLFAERK